MTIIAGISAPIGLAYQVVMDYRQRLRKQTGEARNLEAGGHRATAGPEQQQPQRRQIQQQQQASREEQAPISRNMLVAAVTTIIAGVVAPTTLASASSASAWRRAGGRFVSRSIAQHRHVPRL